MSFHQSATEPAATNVLREPAPPSPTAKQQEVDGDIALVAERCRVKHQACRWQHERMQLATSGANYRLSAVGTDVGALQTPPVCQQL